MSSSGGHPNQKTCTRALKYHPSLYCSSVWPKVNFGQSWSVLVQVHSQHRWSSSDEDGCIISKYYGKSQLMVLFCFLMIVYDDDMKWPFFFFFVKESILSDTDNENSFRRDSVNIYPEIPLSRNFLISGNFDSVIFKKFLNVQSHSNVSAKYIKNKFQMFSGIFGTTQRHLCIWNTDVFVYLSIGHMHISKLLTVNNACKTKCCAKIAKLALDTTDIFLMKMQQECYTELCTTTFVSQKTNKNLTVTFCFICIQHSILLWKKQNSITTQQTETQLTIIVQCVNYTFNIQGYLYS